MTDSKIVFERTITKNWYIFVREEGDKYTMMESTYWSVDDVLEFTDLNQAIEAAKSYADSLYERHC